jgi:hypothetical protein
MGDAMKHPATYRDKLLGLLLALVVALAGCAGLERNTPATPGITVSGPFERAEDGTYVGTVGSDRVVISGEQTGVRRLRFKLNETEWVDAALAPESYTFPVEGLQEGTNTVALRIDAEDGSVAVVVIVIIVDLGGHTGTPVSDPNPQEMVALGEVNNLVFFNSADPEDAETLVVSGIEGSLLGIDVRPADGRLYGLTATGGLYTIDTTTGVATRVGTLSEPFTSRARSGFDFNPVPDALRITGANGQNFRVDPDTGAVVVDGELAFAAGDTNEGLTPSVTASAYTNNVDGAETTQLFNLDSRLNALLVQDPPNDGALRTVGPLGINLAAVAGFDIVTPAPGINVAYVVSGAQLYTVDLATGGATLRGTIGNGSGSFQGLAVLPQTEPPAPAPREMVGLTDSNTLVRFSADAPGAGEVLEVRGVEGTLLAVDVRPATGELYGLASSNRLYTIDLDTGRATQVSRLSEAFNAGGRSGMDFNPTVDRLRLTGANGQNFRVNVDTGEVIVDGDLAYVDGDANAGTRPQITASAYTNSVDGAETTELFNIDSGLDLLVLQDPPNDGGLQTRGALGIEIGERAGFDIATGPDGDTAYLLTNAQLYLIDLESGAATALGAVMEARYQGLAVLP